MDLCLAALLPAGAQKETEAEDAFQEKKKKKSTRLLFLLHWEQRFCKQEKKSNGLFCKETVPALAGM